MRGARRKEEGREGEGGREEEGVESECEQRNRKVPLPIRKK